MRAVLSVLFLLSCPLQWPYLVSCVSSLHCELVRCLTSSTSSFSLPRLDTRRLSFLHQVFAPSATTCPLRPPFLGLLRPCRCGLVSPHVDCYVGLLTGRALCSLSGPAWLQDDLIVTQTVARLPPIVHRRFSDPPLSCLGVWRSSAGRWAVSCRAFPWRHHHLALVENSREGLGNHSKTSCHLASLQPWAWSFTVSLSSPLFQH